MLEPLLLIQAFLFVTPLHVLVDQLVDDTPLENLHLRIERIFDHISSIGKDRGIEREEDAVHRVLNRLGLDQVEPAHRPDLCPHNPDLLSLEFLAERLKGADGVRLDRDSLIGEVDMDLGHLFFDPFLDLVPVVPDNEERGSGDHSFKVRGGDLDPRCCGNRFHPLEPVLDQDLLHGPGLQERPHLGHYDIPLRGNRDLVPDRQGPVVQDHVECCPEAPLLLNLEHGSGPGPFHGKLQLVAHVALGKTDHDEQQVGYSLASMGTDRHDGEVALEIRDPVEAVCRKIQLG